MDWSGLTRVIASPTKSSLTAEDKVRMMKTMVTKSLLIFSGRRSRANSNSCSNGKVHIITVVKGFCRYTTGRKGAQSTPMTPTTDAPSNIGGSARGNSGPIGVGTHEKFSNPTVD